MAINQILPFGTVPGANVLDPADYQALAARLGGFSAGTAKSRNSTPSGARRPSWPP
ncbi:hypothetical protein WJ967_25940 [Achromobacter xylosoxidans]